MKHSYTEKEIKRAFEVICPECGAFKGKKCRWVNSHPGHKKGEIRKNLHPQRIKLAKVKVKVHKEIVQKEVTHKKTPHEKLTPEQKAVVGTILDKIEVFGKHAEFVGPVSEGPIVDTYRFLPTKNTRVAHLESYHKDFAVALGVNENVLVKRMPGESAVGVFVPRKDRKKVEFSDTLPNVAEYMKKTPDDGHLVIPLNLGIDSNGDPMVDDLTEQPHLLVAGSTNSGKSNEENVLALSMLWSLSPDQLKIIISDTKGVEFKSFHKIPHLQFPICTNVYKTMEALSWCIEETQRRLAMFAQIEVKNIHEYNERTIADGKYPYIVIFIDELADVLAEGPGVDRQEAKVNASKLGTIVARSRASGIYVVAATQRPSVNIVKGSIKSNFPSRLAFKLPSSIDSKTVITTKGAESLMKKGDALYSSSTSSNLLRIHAPYSSLDVTKATVESIIQRGQPEQLAPVESKPVSANFKVQ